MIWSLRTRLSIAIFAISAHPVLGQTTQGLLTGQVVDHQSRKGIAGATVKYSRLDVKVTGAVQTDERGFYAIPFLSPGTYSVSAQAKEYQPRELRELELAVASRVELNFPLRSVMELKTRGIYGRASIPGRNEVVNFFGPDVSFATPLEVLVPQSGTLQPSLSYVIDSSEINTLPLLGRDVYTMLVTEPGVTSDAATARGLGLSINGQRPTASNFLLDGLENNNYLITGPLTPIAPEAIEEYRVSTNNFSAEYGGSSGFIANAITRAGGKDFHGIAYFYLKNEILNANAFQRNIVGLKRSPAKEIQPGYFLGGPILRNRLFFSSAFERLRSRSFQDPFTFLFPSTTFVSSLGVSKTSAIYNLLTMYPAPKATFGANVIAPLTLSPPVSVNRDLGIERLDYVTRGGRDRLMVRGNFVKLSRPDFRWTPYKDFITPLVQDSAVIGGSYLNSPLANLTSELRLSYSDDDLHFNRPHPEIPALIITASVGGLPVSDVSLPGSEQFYSYRNVSKSTELLDNAIWFRGRHLVTAGVGLQLRRLSGYLTAGRDARYSFPNLFAAAQDRPASLTITLERSGLTAGVLPQFDRDYTYRQYFLFFQDTYRVSPRLTLNYGVRYENFGSPSNTGRTKDALVRLGSGGTMPERLTGATVVIPTSGDEQLFGTDNRNLAFRVGASYDLFGSGRTLVRGAFGSFYDRPFDNLWQNLRSNDYTLADIAIRGTFNYLTPVSTAVATLIKTSPPLAFDFPDLTLVDPRLLNGVAYSYFAGLQHRLARDFSIEVNGLGTYGRNLITTDVINRPFTTAGGRLNPHLPNINYRASQGFSDYNALSALVRYRASHGFVQASYTFSHYLDNQSDALAGDFFDLNFTQISGASGATGRAAFSRQFNPSSDRGNSDFDQRHNLVLFSYWALPSPVKESKFNVLFRNFSFGALGAFRSGFPYTIVNDNIVVLRGAGVVFNPRPDIVDPKHAVLSKPVPITGGKQLLNPAAFAGVPSDFGGFSDRLGNLGRNSLIGPGLYNIDISLGRSIALPWIGEAGRLTFRADAFNFLNHANLNNPDPFLGDAITFGRAVFGRQGRQSGLPNVSPLNESARQIQLQLKIAF